jgi:hypothetical protein
MGAGIQALLTFFKVRKMAPRVKGHCANVLPFFIKEKVSHMEDKQIYAAHYPKSD